MSNEVSSEYSRVSKLYRLAYSNYVEYDNYLAYHILLNLIKEDYKSYRDSLYQFLHPINQTTYKVINAQNP
jgi:hypothetical protein